MGPMRRPHVEATGRRLRCCRAADGYNPRQAARDPSTGRRRPLRELPSTHLRTPRGHGTAARNRTIAVPRPASALASAPGPRVVVAPLACHRAAGDRVRPGVAHYVGARPGRGHDPCDQSGPSSRPGVALAERRGPFGPTHTGYSVPATRNTRSSTTGTPDDRVHPPMSDDSAERSDAFPDPAGFASLRTRPSSRAERFALGRRLRHDVPRPSLGDWIPPPGRPDIVAQIIDSHEGRLERLIPIRVARMAASPYGFLRGAAVVMAEDLARLPATGIQPVICGDAHLGNFGFYASPELDLVIDLIDFDEAHPGGWEWDLRRLAASVWVAGRQNSLTEEECATVVTQLSATYRRHV